MKIDVLMDPGATTQGEASLINLKPARTGDSYFLDLHLSPFFDKSDRLPAMGMDFLFIASVIYAVDKMVSRAECAEDCWTRDLGITIPVRNLDAWRPVSSKLSDCISFLTGDRWRITMSSAPRAVEQRNKRKRRVRVQFRGDAVSLLSGGLDSFIGAIDWLDANPQGRLVLVGHHDRHVKGPMSDQDHLHAALRARFAGRSEMVQVRCGVTTKAPETSFRSRSFIFIALGVLTADLLGPDTPVIIPENGPIALNVPLSPSRRGSCSTRTVHPRFIRAINEILLSVGLGHEVVNPYAYKTKGEMVSECRVPALMQIAHADTVSCAKSGHTYHWHNRSAGSCGRCVPCLFRRAALFAAGLDSQQYGYDVLSPDLPEHEYGDDFRSLLAFLRRDPTDEAIAQALMTNGPVEMADLPASIAVVKRMQAELRAWIAASRTGRVRQLAGIV